MTREETENSVRIFRAFDHLSPRLLLLVLTMLAGVLLLGNSVTAMPVAPCPPPPPSAAGGAVYRITAVNPGPIAAEYVCITLIGTGGTLNNPVLVANPPGCPVPALSAGNNLLAADWQPVNCVPPGAAVTIDVQSIHPVVSGSAIWRLTDGTIRDGGVTVREIDTFPASTGTVTILLPDGRQDVVQLTGPSMVEVDLTSIRPINGLDTVDTEMLQLQLSGTSGLIGPVVVTLNPAMPTTGQIRENVNNNPGTLDLPPFTSQGTAQSFFDVFFIIRPGGLTLHNDQPAHMQAIITHKPPAQGETYTNPFLTPIPLLDPNGNPTGISIIREVHTPNPVPVGGVAFSVDKPSLVPYVGLASVLAAASVATAIYVRRVRRKEKI